MESCQFTVILKRKEVVAAVLPLQEHWLPLSNLDLLLPPLDVGVFFYWVPTTRSNFTFESMVGTLKKSLAEALVSYYAFAGEVVTNSVGEPEILCNNRGVDFIEAYADVDLHDIQLYNPDATVEGKFVPKKKGGLHGISQAKSISVLPCFRRSLLNPRRPGFYDATIDNMYVPVTMMPPPEDPEATGSDHLMSRIYYVKAQDVEWLQSQATSDGHKRSKLESFSAFLWKIIATSAGDNVKRCQMGIVVNGRARLSNTVNEGDNRSISSDSSMATYFGNVLSIPLGEASIEDLKTKPLRWVADLVHQILEGATTKEHFLGLIDWVEAHRPEPAVTRIYCNKREDGPAFVMSSGLQFPISRVDFGWGRPAFGSYHFPWGGVTGYVMPMPSAIGNGDWVVYMLLLKQQLKLVESNASNVFNPLTSDYLQL
uniref:Shikimate O-hydroxycinnamoyltransferase-like n=1 Tax=Nelumbo nucifera TaxID=4432 RepID=A0A822Z2F8_NELNU|nr:TPA_asm: hypothetical protein HUJ06_013015 [Nelumbo nucifera]